MLAITRRMILPERVFGISDTIHAFFGRAIDPISLTIVCENFLRELEEWRRSAQRVTLAWNSWLAADHRDRDAHYHAFVWALADKEQAAARVKRMIQPTDTSGCAAEPTK
jgi:hypothetical protein